MTEMFSLYRQAKIDGQTANAKVDEMTRLTEKLQGRLKRKVLWRNNVLLQLTAELSYLNADVMLIASCSITCFMLACLYVVDQNSDGVWIIHTFFLGRGCGICPAKRNGI